MNKMTKLYFYYGTVSSAKSMNLLASAHSYICQGKNILLMKPKLDTRFGSKIASRCGLEKEVNFLIEKESNILSFIEEYSKNKKVDCIFVDECQFIDIINIEELRQIVYLHNIPVICYGLKVNFYNHLFQASQRLIELADTIIEIKSICHFCSSKATCNMKHVNGKMVLKGNEIELGGEEKYYPVCYKCYFNQL